MNDSYDLIIVGARVAGAATAALLAEQGARVLLLERSTFPAPTISCPVIFGNSLASFERIGVLPAVEALGAPRIRRYGTRTTDFDLTAMLPAYQGRDYAYSLRRDRLDAAVLDEVRRMPGVTVRENFAVRSLVWGAGRVVGVRGAQGHGPEETIFANGVVGADGKRSLVARQVKAAIYDQLPGVTCIFYAYYQGFEPLDEPSAISYQCPDPNIALGCLVFDADAGLTVISVGAMADQFKQLSQDPEQAVERAWRSIPELARRGRNATRATPVMGQAMVDNFYRQSYGPGWALVGDAGHYIDPITGQGINNALRSAELFAAAYARTRRRSSWMQAMAWYQRERDRATEPIYNMMKLTARLTPSRPSQASAGAMTPLLKAIARQPNVASRYIGIFNGATNIYSFFNPLNLALIVATDFVRNELPSRGLELLPGTARLEGAS